MMLGVGDEKEEVGVRKVAAALLNSKYHFLCVVGNLTVPE